MAGYVQEQWYLAHETVQLWEEGWPEGVAMIKRGVGMQCFPDGLPNSEGWVKHLFSCCQQCCQCWPPACLADVA